MRAIVSKGAQAELVAMDIAPPTAGSGEVVVDVRAIGVGRVDLIMRQLMPADFIPGIEVAGIVTSVGADVDPRWGDRRVFARMQAGGYTEQVVVSEDDIVALPDGVAFESAVASGVNALVARFCIAKAQLIAGETVLVRGAQGGIGHLVVQMARILGAQVIEGRKNSPPVPADVVIDLVAGSGARACIEQLNANGRYVIAGISAGMPPADFAGPLLTDFRRSRSLMTLSLDSYPPSVVSYAAKEVFTDVAAGKIIPIVAETMSLSQANAAHLLLEAGGIVGKVVLLPDPRMVR